MYPLNIHLSGSYKFAATAKLISLDDFDTLFAITVTLKPFIKNILTKLIWSIEFTTSL